MTVHELKIYPKYFAEVKNGNKKFELRKNDRGFKVGDHIELKEWDNIKYTGESLKGEISYILDYAEGKPFGLQDGYCVFSFNLI